MSAVVDAGLVAKSWLAVLGMTAVQGSVLALAALALTRAGRMRPSWHAAVWLVVACKLAIPWGPAMPWSLADLVAMLSDRTDAATPFVLTESTTRTVVEASAWPAVGWIALAAIWAIGASIVIARAALSYRRTARIAASAPDAPGGARDLLASLVAANPLRFARMPRLAVAPSTIGPHVVGMFRPTIVVPPSLVADASLLRVVLLHELAHVRRADAVARLVQIAASALMWWLPVVRLVHRRLDLAREAACDAAALETGAVSRPAYARLLLRMATLETAAHASALAAPRALDARVKAILEMPVRARMTALHGVALVAWIALALGGARSASARGATDVCTYTNELATALYDRFPDADVDGDGLLSRDEACDLQATLRDERTSRFSPEDEAEMQKLLGEPLCCNCTPSVEPNATPVTFSCSKTEGAE